MRPKILPGAIFAGLLTVSFNAHLLAGQIDAANPAQDAVQAPQASSTKREPAQLDTVTVSARKRTEDLQQTPISVSAFSGEELQARGVTNISQIGPMTPNVSFDAGSAIAGSSSTSTIFIRGIGQTDFNLTIDPGVGIYLDGVYISRSVGSLLDTADISQVDVLRGPQGTLFGKNTIGGAIVLTSRQPEFNDYTSGNLELTVGSLHRTDVKAGFNTTLGDRIALLGSLSVQKRDGYGERLTDHQQLGDKNSTSARLAAALQATDALKFTLALDGTHTDEKSPAVKILSINSSALFPYIYNNFSSSAAGCATDSSGANCYGAQWLTRSDYTNWDGDANYSKSDVFGASLTTDLDLDWGKLNSITAYRDLDSKFWLEHDGAPMTVMNSTNHYTDTQFSQEFQLSGNTLSDKFKWVTGLYYLHETGTDNNTLVNGSDTLSFLSGGDIKNTSKAVYAQGTYALTNRLGLTLGGRYSDEKKQFRPDSYIITINSATAAFLAEQGMLDVNGDQGALQAGDRVLPYQWSTTSKRDFSPSATLDYKFTDNVYGYLTYSEGFKSGGFTQRVFPPLTTIPSFDPEYVKSYELGLKTKFFGNRLVVNADVFTMNYSDMQQVVTVLFAPTIQNAGDARIRGAELEFKALPWTWLQINGGVGYTDAFYRSVAAAAAPITTSSELPNTPKWTATLGATAYVYDNGYGSMNIRTDVNYKSGSYKDAVNTAELYQPGYTVANLSVNFILPKQKWSFSAGATNLTDKRYLVTGYADATGAGTVYGVFSAPREWYARVRYDF